MPRNLFDRPPPGDRPYQYAGQTRRPTGGTRYAPIGPPTPTPPAAGGSPWQNPYTLGRMALGGLGYLATRPTGLQRMLSNMGPSWTQPFGGNVGGLPAAGQLLSPMAMTAPWGADIGSPTVAPSAVAPEGPYLPTIMQGAPLQGYGNADPFLTGLYTPQAGGAAVDARAQLAGNLMGDRSGMNRPVGGTTLTAQGATTPGGRVEQQYAKAPPNVDTAWYKQFQVEHGGETPEDFYARTGEGIDEALADREWGDRFAQTAGRAPSEYDWEEHWYATRAYGRPMGNPGPGWRRKSVRGKTDDIPRPPLYVPPQTSWRL